LARRGLQVILTSRDEVRGRAALARLADEGLEVGFHPLDVTDSGSIRALANWLETVYERLDVLVNNAAVSIDEQHSVFRMDAATLRSTFEANVYGVLNVTQALFPIMQRNGYGRIINISSRMGQMSSMGRGDPAYRMSKAALNALTLIMAAELRGSGITVNAMCPGWVRTDMGGASAPRSVQQGADTAIWLVTQSGAELHGGFYRDRASIQW
jgi:NAD(P)-dependent dehydrogenase (short-subunit alcohol dehydrogenase family)